MAPLYQWEIRYSLCCPGIRKNGHCRRSIAVWFSSLLCHYIKQILWFPDLRETGTSVKAASAQHALSALCEIYRL